MKHLSIVSLVCAFAALAIGGYAVYTSLESKVAYIDLQNVFNDFEMTKQYKKKLEAVVGARKNIADSLQLNLKAKSRSIDAAAKASDQDVEDFVYNKEYYIEKVKQFQEDNLALKQQYDAEINKQITQYIKDYGEKSGYRYIFGADGSGIVMYAEQQDNISKEVTEYINKRYNGQAK
jgi:outer membrane protein